MGSEPSYCARALLCALEVSLGLCAAGQRTQHCLCPALIGTQHRCAQLWPQLLFLGRVTITL